MTRNIFFVEGTLTRIWRTGKNELYTIDAVLHSEYSRSPLFVLSPLSKETSRFALPCWTAGGHFIAIHKYLLFSSRSLLFPPTVLHLSAGLMHVQTFYVQCVYETRQYMGLFFFYKVDHYVQAYGVLMRVRFSGRTSTNCIFRKSSTHISNGFLS